MRIRTGCNSVAAGFHSALLYKLSALCLLKAFAHARAIARIRLHRRKAALNQMLGIGAGWLAISESCDSWGLKRISMAGA